MNTSNWIALLAVLVALLGITVPVLLGRMARAQTVSDAARAREQLLSDRKDAEISALREANLNYRLAIIELKGTAGSLDRIVSALPAPPRTEGSAP